MSDMLSIGASGLKAYQVALNTVSENISNAGTIGYSRRTASTSEVAAVGKNTSLNGMGSLVTGIVRAGDFYAAAQVRTAGSDLARTETSVTWLDRIESSLDGNQLSTRLSDFFTASTTLAADPTSLGARASMLEAASGVASAFSSTGKALDQVAQDLDGTARSSVESLNSATATLARINDGLSRAAAGTAGAAALLDQRDQVLEQMSALTDISVDFDAIGRATVHGGGSAGPVLVSGAQAATVIYATNSAGAVSFNVLNGAAQQSLAPSGGALAGVVDSMQRVVDAKSQLQAVAQDFATGVNTVGRRARPRRQSRPTAVRARHRRHGRHDGHPRRPARHRRGGGRRRHPRQHQSRGARGAAHIRRLRESHRRHDHRQCRDPVATQGSGCGTGHDPQQRRRRAR